MNFIISTSGIEFSMENLLLRVKENVGKQN